MAGSKGRAGGAEGRVGGRLSAGSRAQKRLAKAPRIKVVGALSGLTSPAPALSQPNFLAAAGAAQAMSALLGLSPASAVTAAKVAAAAVAASVAAVPAASSGAGASAGSAGQGLAAAPGRSAPAGKRKASDGLPPLPFPAVKLSQNRILPITQHPLSTHLQIRGRGLGREWPLSLYKTLSALSPLVSCASRLERYFRGLQRKDTARKDTEPLLRVHT